MKILFKYTVLLLLSVVIFPSCLKMGLEDLPAYNEAEILSFRFEYRWYDETEGLGRMYIQELDVNNLVIDSQMSEISLALTVPAASEVFPESERDNVGLDNIVGYCDISTAAVISPLGDSPVLGVIGDFSVKELSYKVTAADGTEKIWKLNITAFNK